MSSLAPIRIPRATNEGRLMMSYSSILSSSFGLPEISLRRDEKRSADDAPYPESALA